MSYDYRELEEYNKIVKEYDMFDLFRYIQEQAMTINNLIVYNNGKPDGVVYPDRDIRVGVPSGKKTVLSVDYVPYNNMYKVEYKYTEEEI
jgi:hypothetical protein